LALPPRVSTVHTPLSRYTYLFPCTNLGDGRGSEGPFVTKKGFFFPPPKSLFVHSNIYFVYNFFFYFFLRERSESYRGIAHAANAANKAEKIILSSKKEGSKEGRGKIIILPPLTTSFILLLLFSSVVHWAAGFSSFFMSLL